VTRNVLMFIVALFLVNVMLDLGGAW